MSEKQVALVASPSLDATIQGIKGSAIGNRMETVLHLFLNAVPYAGGSIASVLANHAANKRFERVAEALEYLNHRIAAQGVKVEDVLTEDEVVEVLHSNLNEIATTSDKEKVEFIRNGLGVTFTSKEFGYARKQFFLSLLRSLGHLELATLHFVYLGRDPHEKIEWVPSTTTPGQAPSLFYAARIFKGWRDDDAIPSLARFLADHLHEPDEIVAGVARRLDSLGATNLTPALERSQYRVFEQQSAASAPSNIALSAVSNSVLVVGAPSYGSAVLMQPTTSLVATGIHDPSQSPLELARTALGKSFMEFCR